MNRLLFKGIMCGANVAWFGLNIVITGATIYLAVKEATKESKLKVGL